jgi:hypothetical protein
MVTLDDAKKVIAAAEKKAVKSGQPMNKEVGEYVRILQNR